MVAEEKKGLFGIFKKKQKVAEEIKKPTESAKFEIENEIASIQKLLDEQNLRDSESNSHERVTNSANIKNTNDLAIPKTPEKDEKPVFKNNEAVSLHEHPTEKNKMHKVDSVPDDFTDNNDKLKNTDIKTSTKKDKTDEDLSEIMSFDELDKASNDLEENPSPVEVDELFPRVDKKMSQKKKEVNKILSKEKKGKIILREKKKLEKEKTTLNKKEKKAAMLAKKLKKKEKELSVLEKKVIANQKLLSKEESSITKKIQKLEKSSSSLKEKQKTINPRLQNIEKNEEYIKEKIDEFHRREELIILKEEELKKNEGLLANKEKDLIAQVNKIESDTNMIKEKEKEIEDIFARIEKEKKALEKKENTVNKKIAKFVALDKDYKERKAELKSEQKALVQHEKKLQDKERKLADMQKDINANKMKKASIKKMDATYKKLALKLKDEYRKLEKVYHKRVVIEKGGVFTEQDKTDLVQMKQEKKTAKNKLDEGDIQEFVENTSHLIHKGIYVDANKNIALLISKHHHLSDNSPYKKEIYYDILRLKHELKLALLK